MKGTLCGLLVSVVFGFLAFGDDPGTQSPERISSPIAFDLLDPRRDLNGIGIGFIGSVVTEDLVGAQITLGFNHVGGTVRGVQATCGFNGAGGGVIGAQLSTGFNTAGRNVRGIQVSTAFNHAGGSILGIQATTGFNVAESVRGAQLATGLNIAGDVVGLQTALLNIAEDVRGAQIGLVNIAHGVKLTQIGLLNIAEDALFPIGLVNLVANGQNRFRVLYDESGFINAGFKLGGKRLYNVYSCGIRDDAELALAEIGLGLHSGSKHLFLDLELTAGSLAAVSDLRDTFATNVYGRIKLGIGAAAFGRLGLTGGISYNVFAPIIETGIDVGPRQRLRYAPGWEREYVVDGVRIAMWPGLYLGLEL